MLVVASIAAAACEPSAVVAGRLRELVASEDTALRAAAVSRGWLVEAAVLSAPSAGTGRVQSLLGGECAPRQRAPLVATDPDTRRVFHLVPDRTIVSTEVHTLCPGDCWSPCHAGAEQPDGPWYVTIPAGYTWSGRTPLAVEVTTLQWVPSLPGSACTTSPP